MLSFRFGFIELDFLSEAADQLAGAHTSGRLLLAPAWQGTYSVGGVQAIGFDGRHEKRRIGSYVKGRLTGNGSFGPDLSLAHTEQVLFLLLISLDLPAVEVGLQGLPYFDPGITHQQVGRVSIEGVSVSPVAQWCDNYQTHGPVPGSTAPQHGRDGLVAQVVFFAGREYPTALPGNRFVFPESFRSGKGCSVGFLSSFAALGVVEGLVEPDVLAGPPDENDALGKHPKHGPVAERGIHYSPEDPVPQRGNAVETLPQT